MEQVNWEDLSLANEAFLTGTSCTHQQLSLAALSGFKLWASKLGFDVSTARIDINVQYYSGDPNGELHVYGNNPVGEMILLLAGSLGEQAGAAFVGVDTNQDGVFEETPDTIVLALAQDGGVVEAIQSYGVLTIPFCSGDLPAGAVDPTWTGGSTTSDDEAGFPWGPNNQLLAGFCIYLDGSVLV